MPTKKLTPAQLHRQRALAASAAAEQPADSMAGATVYELHLAQLKQDQHRLKQLQSIQARNKVKPQLLPQYDGYLTGVLEAGKGQQDEVVTTLMLWHLDCGNWQRGLQIAEYVLAYNLNLPDRFERTAATLVAEEVANEALKTLKAEGQFDAQVLEYTQQLTADHDMPDEVRAKLLFAQGLAVQATEDSELEQLTLVKNYFTQAIDLHERVGAKKDLESIMRWLKKHAESKAASDPAQEQAEPAQADS